MSVWEEAVVGDGPVSEKFCNERTKAIADKIDGLGDNLSIMLENFNHRLNAVEEVCKEVGPLKQRMDNGVLGRDFSNKKMAIVISIVMGVFTILSRFIK